MKKNTINRRRFLRGMMQGSAVSVGLPLLDLFLDDNGSAMADGSALPTCFGTWFWGLGLGSEGWAPEQTGSDFELTHYLKALAPIRDKINIYSGLQSYGDGGSLVHSGHISIMTGSSENLPGGYQRSLDALIADKLHVRTRFPSLEVNSSNEPELSFSARAVDVRNPAEVSPLALYKRIFGSGFVDPNAAEFIPDPETLARQSALSAVKEERQALRKQLGASDQQRLDEFFTSLRSLEQQFALELEKPEPLPTCEVPGPPGEQPRNMMLETVLQNHNLFSQLITHALACGQTRIFNSTIGLNVVKKAGDSSNAHIYSHEEPVDKEHGYVPSTYWFGQHFMAAFRDLVQQLAGVREGDGTLLDRTLILACSDHGDAKVHACNHMPVFTAGAAGGGMKTGLHLNALNDPCTRVGLTCQQALGIMAEDWGRGENAVNKAFSEVLA